MAVAKRRNCCLSYRHLLLAAAWTLLLSQVAAARIWSDGLDLTYTSGANSMAYRLYVPQNYNPNGNYPLVLFLHGSGERGDVGNGGTKDLQVKFYIDELIDRTYSELPAIVLAPQLPSTGSGFFSPSNPIDLTDDILASVINSYDVDTNRLYITGLSMGGFGTMNYLNWYANNSDMQFAAAVPMSGGYINFYNEGIVEDFKDVPTWFIHGGGDTVVPPDYSRFTYRSMIGLNLPSPIVFDHTFLDEPTAVSGLMRYTEVPVINHGGWEDWYDHNDFYEWMFAQAVPEPSSACLASIGLVVLAMLRRQMRGRKRS